VPGGGHEVDPLVRCGMSKGKEQRESVRAKGKELNTRTELEGTMNSLWQDLHYGARMLFKNPGITFVVDTRAGPGYWRQHGDLQRRQRGAAATAAL